MNLIVLLFLMFGPSIVEAKEIPHLAEDVKTRLEINLNTTLDWINSLGTPQEVCEIYDQAVRDLYWLEKGAASLNIIGRAGIEFCLQEAQKNENSNSELANKFKAQAKTISYNVASNSWPGWGDEGVRIAVNDIEAGLQAATLNLRLAFELNKPEDKIASAYWLLSALYLALKKMQESQLSIGKSIKFAKIGQSRAQQVFSEGFKGIILIASGDLTLGVSLYNISLVNLRSMGDEEATGYIQQLETAKRIFVGL